MPDPITVSVGTVTETGLIQIYFSRAILINFDKPEEKSEKLRRYLREAYTAEEKEQLASIIKVVYTSEAEEGTETSVVSSVMVVTATSTLIELKLTHSKPLAVSQDPSTPDNISISFDESYFSDPLAEFKINDGKPLIV